MAITRTGRRVDKGASSDVPTIGAQNWWARRCAPLPTLRPVRQFIFMKL